MSNLNRFKADFFWAALFFIIFFGLAVFFVRKYSFDWPHNDDWQAVDWYRNYILSGAVDFVDIFKSKNGSHLIGVQVLFSVLLFKVFGLSYIPLIYAQMVVMALGAMLLGVVVSRELPPGGGRIFVPLLVLAIFFHPIQTEHLTWGYELGWFLINFFLVLNAFLLEKYKEKSIIPVFLVAVLAGFCSAHSAALWVVAAMHFAMVVNGRTRWIGCGVLSLGFLFYVFVVSAITPKGEGVVESFNVIEFFRYYASLLGAVYTNRNGLLLGWVGGGVFFILIFALWDSFRKINVSRLYRLSIVFVVGGALFLLLFAKGRYQYGLPWAMAQFHFGPMLVPVLLGLAIYSLSLILASSHNVWRYAAGVGVLAFLVVGTACSLVNLVEQGNENLKKQGVSMQVMCNPGFSRRMVEEINIASGYYDYLLGRFEAVKHLCTQNVPEVAKPLYSIPTLYVMLSEKQPELKEPLITLWEVYATHFDLQRAFPSNRPDLVLNFAIQDAKNGASYDKNGLGIHQNLFAKIPEQNVYAFPLIR